jgi:hypothetical protein
MSNDGSILSEQSYEHWLTPFETIKRLVKAGLEDREQAVSWLKNQLRNGGVKAAAIQADVDKDFNVLGTYIIILPTQVWRKVETIHWKHDFWVSGDYTSIMELYDDDEERRLRAGDLRHDVMGTKFDPEPIADFCERAMDSSAAIAPTLTVGNMDHNKIGNARQQDDNRIAVQNAKGLGTCCQELAAFFTTQELQQGDFVSEQMAAYQAMVTQRTQGWVDVPSEPMALDSFDQESQDRIKRFIMSDKAVRRLRAAIIEGELPIWRIHDAREVMVTPQRLDPGNIQYGVFKTFERPEPDMQGALLWVKITDWEKYLASYTTAVPRFTETERKDWIRNCSNMAGDAAYKKYKHEPRFDGTKQAEFRKEWTAIRGAKRGRPPHQKRVV